MADLIVLDFETYYDKDYSLSKLTTEEYLRDPRFEVIGFSIRRNDEPTVFYRGTHAELHLMLASYHLQNAIVVAHNARFDVGILSWHYGIRPGFIIDTMGMANALFGLEQSVSLAKIAERFGLPAKGDTVVRMLGKRGSDLTPAEWHDYADYCKRDTDITRSIFDRMRLGFPRSELEVIDWSIRAFTEPKLTIDTDLMAREIAEFDVRRAALLSSLNVSAERLRSDEMFAGLLMDAGVVPPTKPSPTNPDREVFAFAKTDLEFTDLLEHPDERVQLLVEARLGTKTSIQRSRMERMLAIGRRGLMPFPVQYYGAKTTGRFAGDDKLNVQNFPNKGAVRAAVRAPKGWLIGAADLSQIELRVNAWHAGEVEVLQTLASGGDVYSSLASEIFGIEVTKALKALRFVGKTGELGCGYGCGAEKFHTMLQVAARRENIALADASPQFAKRVVDTYREKRANIVNFWKTCNNAIQHIANGSETAIGPYVVRDHGIWLPNGLRLYYPNLRQEERFAPSSFYGGEIRKQTEWVYDRHRGRGAMQTTRLYGGKLDENITQAVARLFMTDAMLVLIRAGMHIVGTVHDELIFLVPDTSDRDGVIKYVHQTMTTAPSWASGIPLDAEVKLGLTYDEVK